MKFVEIASAEEQLALWKLVNDSVWDAIQQRAADARKHKAAQGAARKQKPKAKRTATSRGATKKPITYKPPPKPKALPQHILQQAPAPLPPSLNTKALPPITLNSGQTTGDFTASAPSASSGPVGLGT